MSELRNLDTVTLELIKGANGSARAEMEALLRPPAEADTSLDTSEGEGEDQEVSDLTGQALLYRLQAGPAGMNVQTALKEIAKLRRLRTLGLPADLFASVPPKILQHYRQRVTAEDRQQNADGDEADA